MVEAKMKLEEKSFKSETSFKTEKIVAGVRYSRPSGGQQVGIFKPSRTILSFFVHPESLEVQEVT